MEEDTDLDALLDIVSHNTTPCPTLDAIEVRVARTGAMLRLDYVMRGDIGAIKIPPPDRPRRTDSLWQTTCFEAFFMRGPPAYHEYNLSPSTRWAAYSFDDYRAGTADLETPAPEIAFEATGNRAILTAQIAIPDGPLHLGLSAVIETRDGAKSYWALAHPPGPPDFHHRDCFALELPPVESSLRGA